MSESKHRAQIQICCLVAANGFQKGNVLSNLLEYAKSGFAYISLANSGNLFLKLSTWVNFPVSSFQLF